MTLVTGDLAQQNQETPRLWECNLGNAGNGGIQRHLSLIMFHNVFPGQRKGRTESGRRRRIKSSCSLLGSDDEKLALEKKDAALFGAMQTGLGGAALVGGAARACKCAFKRACVTAVGKCCYFPVI